MSGSLTPNEELIGRLPLPLAQIYRRAHNAKTPLDRHQAAYYLWEVTLKILGSVAIIAYADRSEHDPELAERLKNLARPSLGHWWEFIRKLLPVLANAGDEGFRTVRDLVLGRARSDLPKIAALDTSLREALSDSPGSRNTVRLSELLNRLVEYRNRSMFHGGLGMGPSEFYDHMGRGAPLRWGRAARDTRHARRQAHDLRR